MNLSNQLTLSRLFLTVLFVGALTLATSWSLPTAFFLFSLATFTDWLDGFIARRYQLCTNVGRLLDPLADKVLVSAAFICLIPFQALPAWAVVIIIARELLITGLRLLACEKGVIIASDRFGKHKTGWQFATILFYLLLLSVKQFSFLDPRWILWSWDYLGPVLIGITLLLTVASGASCLWKNRDFLK
ncbi:MAG: CDP-diacylglycerol--glycerol-3-phosphate 3-phosphatidyltransferase [Chthoniobacterales bacterium]|nr:CDP-diacylglycerol--glycerol-3-phosphate 3-phosphatidyltransferase [Chthoniobacterales bacterium]